MPRYRRKSPIVDAFQLEDTPTSQRHIINFGKGHITHGSGNSVAVMVDGNYETALPGDFIIKDENGNFEVWSAQDFTFEFEHAL